MIEVLKQALEALEVEDLACRYEKEQTPEHIAKAITSLRQALAELESQEPVAIVREQFVRIGNKDSFQRRLCIAGLEGNHLTMSSLKVNDKLFTHPPQHKPLTDEIVGLLKEARKIIRASSSRNLVKDWDERTTKAIAAHGIKE